VRGLREGRRNVRALAKMIAGREGRRNVRGLREGKRNVMCLSAVECRAGRET